MRAIDRGTVPAGLLAAAVLVLPSAGQDTHRMPENELGPGGQAAAPEAVGSLVAGPLDIESGPFDNRCLGVEEAWGHYWVTGAGHTTTGWNHMIHKYDYNGIYVGSFPQVTQSTGWGGRDMEADESSNLLWAGSDKGELSEYAYSGGGLTWVTFHSAPTSQTIQALCMDPKTGHFFTKSFTNRFYEFDLTGTIYLFSFVAVPSACGFGWEPVSSTIWSTHTGPMVMEITNQCIPTGQFFGPTFGAGQGGVDVYEDHRNPGYLSIVVLGQGTPDSIEVYDTGVVNQMACNPPTFYCRYKDPSGSTSCGGQQCDSNGGCKATIYTSPIAEQPVHGASNYVLGVTGTENNKSGLIFYGYGSLSLPFSSGSLCVSPPLKRTLPQSTGNHGGDPCSGWMWLIINNPGEPVGTTVYYQAWMRDPSSPSGTDLSDAVEVGFELDEDHLGDCVGSKTWSVDPFSPNQTIVQYADANQGYQVENRSVGTVLVTRNGMQVKILGPMQSTRLTTNGGDTVAVSLLHGMEASGYWMRDPN